MSIAEELTVKETGQGKKAIVYRMVTDEHICPFGLKTVDLLKRKGFEVEDNWLTNRAETDAFKDKHDVKTTPQTFIEGERIGGFDDLREHFGYETKDPDKKTYTPVLVVFAISALLASAASWATLGDIFTLRSVEWFIAFSMGMLAMLKLRDLDSFANMFLVYIDKRDLKCACVGGGANVPLGFISLSENLAMMGMGIWMIVKAVA